MKFDKLILAATVTALPFTASVTQAATVVTTEVFAEASIDGVVQDENTDTNVNATSSAAANAEIGGFGTQQANGVSTMRIAGGAADGEEAHINEVVATQTISETNTSGAAQSYSLDFLLTGISAFLNGDFGGASAGPNPYNTEPPSGGAVGARFAYTVEVNGTEIYSAGLEMFGGAGTYSADNVNNVSFTGAPQNCGTFGCTGYLFEIADLSGTLDVGTFADGETFEVITTLAAETYLNGFENEVDFSLGDPTGLNAGVLSDGGTPAPVPLPAAGWMLMAGLGGLVGLRRRRKN